MQIRYVTLNLIGSGEILSQSTLVKDFVRLFKDDLFNSPEIGGKVVFFMGNWV